MRIRPSVVSGLMLIAAGCRTAGPATLKDDADVPLPATHVEIDAKAPHLSNSKIDVLSYDIDLTFPTFAAGNIAAKMKVALKLTTPSSDVKLHMAKDAITIGTVSIGGHPAPFQVSTGINGQNGLAGDVLTIQLGSEHAAGAAVAIAIDYTVKAKAQGDRGLLFRANYEGAPIFVTRNWPYYARFWLPSNDHPADTATLDATLRVPPTAVAAANGKLVAGTLTEGEGLGTDGLRLFRWSQPTPIPTYGINITVGNLDVISETVCFDTQTVNEQLDDCDSAAHKIPVAYYIQQNHGQRQEFMDAAKTGSRSLAFFSSLMGPYPYEKLGYVTAPHPFNMESVSLIVMVSPEATVHEVAHHWWGNTVYIGHWGDLWISEGFTTYFTGLYDEFATGTNTACEQTSGLLNAGAETDPLAIFNDTPYCKGSSALGDLRKRMAALAGFGAGSPESRAIFFTLARRLFNDHRFKRLTTATLYEWLRQNAATIIGQHGITPSTPAIESMLSAWSAKWFGQPLQD